MGSSFYSICKGISSRLYFYKLLLPNIDLIEPGLTGQKIDSFPGTIIYGDENSKNTKSLEKVATNYIVLFPCTLLAWFIVLLITAIPTGILRLIPIQIVINLLNILGQLFTITWFVSLFIIVGIFTNHSSIITRRLRAITLEIERLRQEEMLQMKLQEVKEVSSDVIGGYVDRVKEIRKILSTRLYPFLGWSRCIKSGITQVIEYFGLHFSNIISFLR
jgi:uncharacterized protein (UPF0335 family)